MPNPFIFKQKGSRYFRYYYYLETGGKRTYGSTRRSDRQSAETVARKAFREAQLERDGLLEPKSVREGQAVPLVNYVEEFITRSRKAGRDARCVYQVERHILKLFKECAWTYFKDITRDSFERWRSRQDVKPKTLNEHQSSISKFLTWLFKCGRIPSQPLAGVEKARLRGTDKRERRAFTGEELQMLLAVAGDRGVVYLTAAYTGLRRGELKALEWRDLHLDGDKPHIRARASTTKNGKAASLPLHPDVVAALRALQSKGNPEPKVFPRLVPEMELFKKHLALAGIPYDDERGRKADFHSLRNTFATILTLNGAPQREVMELMRHSDMRLTAKVYTDAGQLPLSKTVNALPSVNRGEQIVEQVSVPARPEESTPVQAGNLPDTLEPLKNKALGLICPPVSTPVKGGEKCTRQESNLNLRLRRPQALLEKRW